ncbi:MAG: SGNH/GDSL hydrolase family protein [Victivallaceae bacterium]|nr:SGNH/GDSL hydrolase family protein [Victivallaceae bacterium]
MDGKTISKFCIGLNIVWLSIGLLGAQQYDAIKNGGFESLNHTGKIANWHPGEWSRKHYSVTLTPDKKFKVEGKQSGRVKTSGVNPNLVLWQDVNVGGNTSCKLTLMAKPDKNVNVKAELICYDKVGSGKKIVKRLTGEAVNSDNLWYSLNVSLKTPATTKMIRVILRSNGNVSFDKVVFLVDGARLEPSNARQLKQKKAVNSTFDVAADAQRKAKMSPQELAWEKILEENLGSYYLPVYKRRKLQGRISAWDFVKDNPELPRVLLIGDSISRAYTLPTRKRLSGKVNLHRAPANCGSTGTGLKKLDVWLGDGHWDLIYFNFGIHNRNSTPKIYAQDLEKIIVRLKKSGAKLVWAQSTPLSGTKYKQGSMLKLNSIAKKVMDKYNIPVSDLYTSARAIQRKFQIADGCHYSGEGYKHISKLVAKDIIKYLQ